MFYKKSLKIFTKTLLIYSLTFMLGGIFPLYGATPAHKTIRVGVYDNPPKLLLGDENKLTGILGDILNEIAQKKKWQLVTVPCEWQRCLTALKNEEIDILPDVAFSDERAQYLDFNQTPALNSWSSIYIPIGTNLDSFLDIQHKRIAVLAGSIQESYLQHLLADFGLEVTFIPVQSLEIGFSMVASHKADAAAANHFYGDYHAARYNLKASPIIFQPAKLFYASAKGKNSDLLATIDQELDSWKSQSDSPYFKTINKWITGQPTPALPSWWLWLVFGLIITAVLAMIMNTLLREKVRLRAAELEDTLNAMPDLLFELDINGKYISFRSPRHDLLAAPPEAFIGKTVMQILPIEMAQRCMKAIREADIHGLSNGTQIVLDLPNGRHWFELSVSRKSIKGNEPPHFIVISRDITERVLAEQTSRENELRYRTLINATSVVTWTCPPSGLHIKPQPQWMAFTGQSETEMLDDGWTRAVHPDDLAAATNRWITAVASGAPFVSEHRIRRYDGEWRWMNVNAVPVRDEAGQVVEWFGMNLDITDRKIAEDKIEHLAFHDHLTGLPNRLLFTDRLAQTLATSRRTNRFGAVLFVDLDRFKQVNDVYGHEIGDALIQDIAQRLSHFLREGDTVSRFGGDEFVILLPELSHEMESAGTLALSIAEKLRTELEKPTQLSGRLYRTTASIGISLFPKIGEDVEDLIREADIAMYRAKDEGRNALVFFEHTMQASVSERYDLEQDLREAVLNNDLQLYLQSQVNTHGEIIGAEALLRWPHKKRGFVNPATFIPIAEETGLIVTLGEWVLRETCQVLNELKKIGSPLRIAINVSPRQFHHSYFVTRVKEILTETATDPKYLTMEITENLLLKHSSEVVPRMLELAELGIRFAIDDFGTGYSSLAYLKRLPLKELKIDKSFVQDIPKNPNDVALVETILSMARHLNYEVVAEGVETQAQVNILRSLICEYYQGYFFHRPQPWHSWIKSFNQECVNS